MSLCVPIKEMKNTASFAQLVESSSEPVIVTRNGYDAFAVMTIDQLEMLKLEAARVHLYQDIDEAEADIAAGRVTTASESQQNARKRYGL